MSFFDFIVPVIALAVAAAGALLLRREARKLDAKGRHPAE